MPEFTASVTSFR